MIALNKKIRLNRRLFTTSTFDSGELGVLASVVHKFPAGRYQVVVRREKQDAGSTQFLVDKSSVNMQLTIDLESVAVPVPASGMAEIPTVSPKGYVQFYVSGGVGGYSVVAREASGTSSVFDSTTLSDGDLFVVSLLIPAKYSMANKAGNASGEIQVSPVPEGTNLRSLETQFVEVNSDSFVPTNVSVQSAQGLVFRIKGPSRVVIIKVPEEPRVAAIEGKRIRRRRTIHLHRLQ
jgi:hypothetical protein